MTKKNENQLKEKEEKSIEIILEAYKRYNNKLALAWTGGKDSTVLLHLVKRCFSGTIPYPIMFNDSTMEFDEVYNFIDEIIRQWKLRVDVVKHLEKDLKKFFSTNNIDKKKTLSRIMKINALNHYIRRNQMKGYIVGIRWDEHESRSKEDYFAVKKNQIRVHPILHFSESDIWQYIRIHNIPYVSLYDNGYRSLGEKYFTSPTKPNEDERSGREKSKEKLMNELRELGYW